MKKLKHISTVLRGKFSYRPRNDPRFYDGPYPFIQTGDVAQAGKYIIEYQQTLNELGFAIGKEFPSNTLVMSIAANIGDVAILGFTACFPDSIVGLIPKKNTDIDFLYYNAKAMKAELLNTATLNTQLNINVERIGALVTALPPIEEQRAITQFLDYGTTKIDTLNVKVSQHIDRLKEFRAALISAAVTGKIDVREESA